MSSEDKNVVIGLLATALFISMIVLFSTYSQNSSLRAELDNAQTAAETESTRADDAESNASSAEDAASEAELEAEQERDRADEAESQLEDL